MKITTPLIAALLASSAVFPAHAEELTKWRLFVSDHEAPTVRVIDPMTAQTDETFTLSGPSSLSRSESGRTVFAVQGKAGVVNAIGSGIAFEDHGDHGDILVEAPKLLPLKVKGEKPSHVVDRNGQVALFFDGDGISRNLRESAVLDGKADVTEIKSPAPHHGVAVAWGKYTVLSAPDPEGGTREDGSAKPPVGLQVMDAESKPVGDVHACPHLHGEASSGNLTVLACETGLLLARNGENGPEITHLPYGADLPEGKTTTLIGGHGLQYFVGNYGPDKVVLIDPSDANAFRLVELPTRRVHFAADPIRARFSYIVTEDGQLHRLDALSGTIDKSIKLTQAYSMDGNWSDPRPRIAVAGDVIAVSDPLAAKVHLVDAASFTAKSAIPVEGKPFNMVAVGGSGEAHSAEAYDHAHSHGDPKIYQGYFEDAQVQDRALSDYAGDWQSVYPYLQDGTLDPVWAHKAESGKASVEEIRAEYETGYKTDVERITIEGDTVSFFKDGKPLKGRYAYDSREILTYKKGNRGVRFIFRKTEGDAEAPQFIQFSDHKIAPEKANHYHLYWGNDRAALLEEVTNWPTYYPSSLSAKQIVSEMLAH